MIMSKLTVSVPSATRPAVARQTLQVALNRSVPAVTEECDRSLYTYPAHQQSKKSRMAPTSSSTTNEFGTRTPRSPLSREPAGTKIVDFGKNVELRPRGQFNVRGVGQDGFFPPVKLKTGTTGVRFSTSASSVRSSKTAQQQTPSSPAVSPLNVELAPAKTPKSLPGAETDPPGRVTDDWLPSARTENMARKHLLQDQPANPYNTRAAASKEIFSLKGSSPSPSEKALKSGSNLVGSGTQSQARPNKDAAWVRSFKVRQRRNNRVKEILESKPAGLTMASPINFDSFR
ncbi:uncharacterized protein LOC110985597 [Acanthaster planci]|uniref:Uncharacterized protein LOC110985597 n=1 Tax=Acanthaster planci TaxID=133434 RepID=A0A8B7ZGQ4_ACAPL|nr:uncharacterized protein LOC110985597 [Acanthaster planci]